MAKKLINLYTTTCLLVSLCWCFVFVFLSVTAQKSSSTSKVEEVKVGVILDLETTLSQMWLSCLEMAISEFYKSNESYKTRIVLTIRDSKRDVVGAASAALELIKNEQVQAIIGPQTSVQASFVIDLGEKAHVPIISFSATSPSLASFRSSFFFRAAQNDSSQVQPIAALFRTFGWSHAVPVYADDAFGESIVPYLVDALQSAGVRVPHRAAVSPAATDDKIAAELYELMTMQSRVFVVHAPTRLGSRLFARAEEMGLMDGGCVWIVTNALADLFGVLNGSVVDSMQGVLGVRTHVPRSRELEGFRVRFRSLFRREHPEFDAEEAELNAFGLWAYDAAFALAMAAEKVADTDSTAFTGPAFVDNGDSRKNSTSTDLDTLGVSRNGPRLRDELAKIRFRGLAGNFSLENGQLQSSAFEVVNVIGKRERTVGYWTPSSGLERGLNSKASRRNSASGSSLGPIIWPGESLSVPKGWVTPTKGKRLRIGVPVKFGNSTFVRLRRDASTNRTQVSGFSIEVFNAVMELMPYAVLYDFVPFDTSAGSYNDMIQHVSLGDFDAVAADVTIVSNRSRYVDFTLPYTESGVTMIVPIKGMRMKNAWVFLKPLTWDLWATTGGFFVFIAFVVWVLEHRINNDFRGPPLHQMGTSFWFSFSTMVFAHRENVVSNWARFVVVIWCFVVLILTQSYTASLTSMLTVQQLRPALTDVKELLKNKENIGFPRMSFVLGMLQDFIDFQKSQIKEYKSLEHLGELFANGEISAAFDEIPYLKLFIATHCSRFAMVGPIYKTDGFGFAFPRGSPLVGDVSRAILNVTEGDKMKKIENAWFVSDTTCIDPSAIVSSVRLSLNSFWGLFLIAGVTSLSALAIFLATFLYEHGRILVSFDSEPSLWQRIGLMLGTFDNKDLSSHTFRKTNELQNTSTKHNAIYAVNDSPSPSNCTNQTEFHFTSYEDPGTPSATLNSQKFPENDSPNTIFSPTPSSDLHQTQFIFPFHENTGTPSSLNDQRSLEQTTHERVNC